VLNQESKAVIEGKWTLMMKRQETKDQRRTTEDAMGFQDKVALVTGAGSGIGRATALRFAAEGAAVIAVDIDDSGVNETAQQIRETGGNVAVVVANIAERAGAQSAVHAALDNFKRLDILVNNAGITRDALNVRVKDGEVKTMSDEQWDAVLNVNLKGSWLVAQAASVPMIQAKAGRIINTSSIAALGNIGQVNYAASKAGVIGLTKTLALELARFNITVNAVAPGAVETRMTAAIPDALRAQLIERIPLKYMAKPEEIAGVHAFLAGEDARYITGQVIFVDGGLSVGS
jgi:3-oxoacyl-[acyl-carrier protein] reductase